jgi:hypothetical protein
MSLNKACIFLFHLSTGDNFTMYGAVRHLQKIYKDVYIFCLYRNRYTVKQMYQQFNNIHIHIILNEDYNNCIVPNHLIELYKANIKNYDLYSCGSHINNFYEVPGYFWSKFYDNINLPYSLRYEYNDINRNSKEDDLYNKVVEKYGKKYIFLHDHRNVKYKHICERADVNVISDYPIFHPNFNYYSNIGGEFNDLWSQDFLSDNLFDYCMLIENATEIHISDSSFSCLMPYLDLKKVQKKVIHTSYCEGLVNYHEKFKDWEIVKQ